MNNEYVKEYILNNYGINFELITEMPSDYEKYQSLKHKKGKVEYTDYDLPRSFVLCKEKDDYKIRLSRISTPGLNQRIGGKNKILGEM